MPVDDLLEQAVALLMHEELESNRLEVTIAPCWGNYGDDGRWNRLVEWRNPEWYQELCATYTANRSRPRRRRKHDTLIKRANILRALQEIGGGYLPHRKCPTGLSIRRRAHPRDVSGKR